MRDGFAALVPTDLGILCAISEIVEAASACSNDAACELGVQARMVVLCCDHPALTVAQDEDLREQCHEVQIMLPEVIQPYFRS